MKALVTGSNGFIGSHLVEGLLSRGYDVHCLVRKTSNLRWIKDLNIHLVYGDCTDKSSLQQAVKGMDYVFHAAAVINARDWETYFRNNTLGTANMIEACLQFNLSVKKFVFISSIAAAGPSPKGSRLSEDDPPVPISDYGRSKLLAEQIVLSCREEIPVTIIRPPNVIGPRQKELFDALKLIKKRVVPLVGNKDKQTSLCYVKDLVRAVILAAEAEEAKSQIFFVTDPNSYSWREITNEIRRNFGIRLFYIKVPYFLQYLIVGLSERISALTKKTPLASREQLVASKKFYWIYDGSKIKKELGFEAATNLKDGIKKTIEWYQIHDLL